MDSEELTQHIIDELDMLGLIEITVVSIHLRARKEQLEKEVRL